MSAPASGPGPAMAPARPVDRLPDFPWDLLASARALAESHADRVVDLSIGTPVDPVAAPIRRALADASNSPGYPTVHGTAELREAYVGWLSRAHGVTGLDPDDVLPTMGSKELVASLPSQLGVRPGQTVVIPEQSYPTYEVGALMAGATVLRADTLAAIGSEPVPLLWLNSPGNPTGRVLGAEQLARVVQWARERGTVVASDECYLDLGWDSAPLSILHPDVSGGDHRGLLAVHSLSKRSNMAGYRIGFVSGDPDLVASLLALRRHVGAMVSAPVQAAAVAALGDDGHVLAQQDRYSRRRSQLIEAFEAAGFTIEQSDGGLYLWVTRDEPCMESVHWLAERGIVVAPGSFYGPSGDRHIRVAFTATDERVAAACERLLA